MDDSLTQGEFRASAAESVDVDYVAEATKRDDNPVG
jgi:hypothetical protein